MDRKDWFFKQLVTQAEMDGGQDLVELEFGAMLSHLMGKRFHGTSIGSTEDPDGNQTGSICHGLQVSQTGTPSLLVAVSYGVGLVPTQIIADSPVKMSLRESQLSAIAWAPMVASFGDPRGTQVSTFSLAATVAAISSSMFVKARLYAKLARVETDPRTDGNGDPVNFNHAVGQLIIEVDVGAEAASQGAAVAPTVRADTDSIQLAVVELDDAMTQIFTATDIFHQDRRYNGWTAYGADRPPIQVLSFEDTTTGLATGTKGELIQTVSHGFNYSGHVTATPASFDSGTIETRRGIFAAHAAEGNGAGDELCGLRRDYLKVEQVFMVLGETANDIVSGVGIIPLGMTDSGEAFSLTEDDVDFRARFANDSGETVTIYMQTRLSVYDRRAWNSWLG